MVHTSASLIRSKVSATSEKTGSIRQKRGAGMSRQRTFGEYRAIDLTLLGIMLIIFESIIYAAATKLFPAEPYSVLLVASITAIVLMRWGIFGAIHAALGGIVYCVLSHGTFQHYLVYVIGNLFALFALILFKFWSKEDVRLDALKSVAFALLVQLLMQLGRCVVSIALGSSFMQGLAFFTTDVISDLFTVVIIWIARRLDGVFEDQKHYLIRIQKETEKDKGTY